MTYLGLNPELSHQIHWNNESKISKLNEVLW